ncbi:MAG: hypothetical protein CFE21_02005 [Bacteroidetes bacterium B1(2017)]|nr:MAG: hypothetical protein CFE21_02005 [Bacteroidetes bacterium B1(2017)]
MESLLIFLPNLLVGVWCVALLIKGIAQVNKDASEHLNGWRFILIEALTTLISPFFGFALMGNPNSNNSSEDGFTPHLFPPDMYYTILIVYCITIIAYWVIKLNPELLAQTSYLFVFTILVWVLILITLVGALEVSTKNKDGLELMFFPVFGFPIMAIFINFFVYTYRLIWCNAMHKSLENEGE